MYTSTGMGYLLNQIQHKKEQDSENQYFVRIIFEF